MEKDDSLEKEDISKFRYTQDSLKMQKRGQSNKEREKPNRKVSNVVEVEDKNHWLEQQNNL